MPAFDSLGSQIIDPRRRSRYLHLYSSNVILLCDDQQSRNLDMFTLFWDLGVVGRVYATDSRFVPNLESINDSGINGVVGNRNASSSLVREGGSSYDWPVQWASVPSLLENTIMRRHLF